MFDTGTTAYAANRDRRSRVVPSLDGAVRA
jgi:hypothetical protein